MRLVKSIPLLTQYELISRLSWTDCGCKSFPTLPRHNAGSCSHNSMIDKVNPGLQGIKTGLHSGRWTSSVDVHSLTGNLCSLSLLQYVSSWSLIKYHLSSRLCFSVLLSLAVPLPVFEIHGGFRLAHHLPSCLCVALELRPCRPCCLENSLHGLWSCNIALILLRYSTSSRLLSKGYV